MSTSATEALSQESADLPGMIDAGDSTDACRSVASMVCNAREDDACDGVNQKDLPCAQDMIADSKQDANSMSCSSVASLNAVNPSLSASDPGSVHAAMHRQISSGPQLIEADGSVDDSAFVTSVVPDLVRQRASHTYGQSQNVKGGGFVSSCLMFLRRQGGTKQVLSLMQGLWEHSAVSTCANPHTPREILITGKLCTKADVVSTTLLVKRDCIKFESWTLNVDREDQLCFTDAAGRKDYYTRAFVAPPNMTAELQGEWCPDGAGSPRIPHLFIQGPCWRFSATASHGPRQGFLRSDREHGAVLLHGCRMSVLPHGGLSLTLHDGVCLYFVRHMEATAVLFAATLSQLPKCASHHRRLTRSL